MNIVASWLQITMTWKDEKKSRGMSISVAAIQWKWKPERTEFKVRHLKVTQECQTKRSEVGGWGGSGKSGKGNERRLQHLFSLAPLLNATV
jgi:hypothetical protein